MSTRLLVADDHRLVRTGLVALIAGMPDCEVVAEASDGVEALERVADSAPDLVLLDINMPRLSGLDCLARLRQMASPVKALILSMHANEEHVRRALELGAMGYLLKESTVTDLELAIRTVSNGHVWLTAEVSAILTRPASFTAVGESSAQGDLSPRQQVVLKRLAEGASMKEIAFELELSVKTVETYRSQLMEKLQLGDLPALVRYAIRQGIIGL